MNFVYQLILVSIWGIVGGLTYFVHPALSVAYIIMIIGMLGFHMEDLFLSLSGHSDNEDVKQ